jgi:hypothetical protein
MSYDNNFLPQPSYQEEYDDEEEEEYDDNDDNDDNDSDDNDYDNDNDYDYDNNDNDSDNDNDDDDDYSEYLNAMQLQNIDLDEDINLIDENGNTYLHLIVNNMHKTQKDEYGNIEYNSDPLCLVNYLLMNMDNDLINQKNNGNEIRYRETALEIAIRKAKCKHNPKYEIYNDIIELFEQAEI